MKRQHTKNAQVEKGMVIAGLAAVFAVGGVGIPSLAHASSTSLLTSHSTMAMQHYEAVINQLNNTGVHGTAAFTTRSNELTVTINATGLAPGVHPIHIHGKNMMEAECPTIAQDTNGDGYLSVIEGAPSYGLIKISLTSPETSFGTPPTPALFYSFAGTPNNANFPLVGSDGKLQFTQTYTFDTSADAQAAYASLTPLGNQAIVIHGATAPRSVDAPALAALGHAYPAGTDLTARVYDALLPAGCGVIEEASTATVPTAPRMAPLVDSSTQQEVINGLTTASSNASDASSFNNQVTAASAHFAALVSEAQLNYQNNVAQGMNKDQARNMLINAFAGAKDMELNALTASRNQLIDQLNQTGSVTARDSFLNSFNSVVDHYAAQLEMTKNQI